MKDDYTISEIEKSIVVDFVQKHHYSKILPTQALFSLKGEAWVIEILASESVA